MRAVALAALLAAAAMAHAQSAKPVWIIVPYAPGGGVDVYARMLAQELPAVLGQPVQVENKPGANSNIGAEYVAKSAPDGRTFMMNTNAYIINASIYSNLSFDPLRDLVPVAILGTVPLVISVNSNVPVHSLAELIALGRKKDSNLAFSSCGNGTSQHLAGELFKARTGSNIVHVPYKGTAAAMTAIGGGEVSAISTVAADIKSLVAAGRARLLAVAGEQRDPNFPDVPTFREQGFDLVAKPWYGLFAPAGTPAPVVAKLHGALDAIMRQPAVRARLAQNGMEVAASTPEALGTFVVAEIAKWKRIVAEAKIEVE